MKPSALIVIDSNSEPSTTVREKLSAFYDELRNHVWLYQAEPGCKEIEDDTAGVRHLPLRPEVTRPFGDLSFVLTFSERGENDTDIEGPRDPHCRVILQDLNTFEEDYNEVLISCLRHLEEYRYSISEERKHPMAA